MNDGQLIWLKCKMQKNTIAETGIFAWLSMPFQNLHGCNPSNLTRPWLSQKSSQRYGNVLTMGNYKHFKQMMEKNFAKGHFRTQWKRDIHHFSATGGTKASIEECIIISWVLILQDIWTFYLPLWKDTMSNHRSIGMKPFQVTLENASDI